jgi:hypothetical protein
MTLTASQSTNLRRSDADLLNDDLLNDEFHALLRDAAEKREGRALVQSAEDTAAARQESSELLALARGRRIGRPPAER